MPTILLLAMLWFSTASCGAELPPYPPVEAMHADVARRIAAGEFSGLLEDADRFQKSQERFGDGRWKLAVFYRCLREGFSDHASSESDWHRYQTALAALTTSHARSSNAWLMLAALHDSHAWAERGGGYADTVTEVGFDHFKALLEQSREILNKHKAALSDNPQWYALRIAIGGSAGDDPRELDALFAEGVRKTPDYQQTWFARLHFLTPKWGGSIGEMANFIAHGRRFATGTEGAGMTARLLRFADDDGSYELVRQPGIDWDDVKKSYDDVLDRYPVNFNAQYYLLESCGKSDKLETAHLLVRSQALPVQADLGQNAGVYGLCVQWATGKIPAFIMRDHDTGVTRTIR